MNQPVTELDHRFSDPNAGAADWECHPPGPRGDELSWICTARPDGRPHLTPLVAVWSDDAL